MGKMGFKMQTGIAVGTAVVVFQHPSSTFFFWRGLLSLNMTWTWLVSLPRYENLRTRVEVAPHAGFTKRFPMRLHRDFPS